MIKYTQKFQRNKKKFPITLTNRDIQILQVLNAYRYLKASQIKRLIAPNTNSPKTIQVRLKKLYHNSYIGRTQPFIQLGKGVGEIIYHIQKRGIELLESHGYTPKSLNLNKVGSVKLNFLDHAVELSEFRINLELALQSLPDIHLKRFIADFEIKSNHSKLKGLGKNRYELYTKLKSKETSASYIVYPDALILLEANINEQKFDKLIFLEIDRGTETLKIVENKVLGYDLYFKNNVFSKFGSVKNFTLLFQCSSERRALNILEKVKNIQNNFPILATSFTDVNEKSILQKEIWTNTSGVKKRIINISKITPS